MHGAYVSPAFLCVRFHLHEFLYFALSMSLSLYFFVFELSLSLSNTVSVSPAFLCVRFDLLFNLRVKGTSVQTLRNKDSLYFPKAQISKNSKTIMNSMHRKHIFLSGL